MTPQTEHGSEWDEWKKKFYWLQLSLIGQRKFYPGCKWKLPA